MLSTNYMPIFWACLCMYMGQNVGRVVDIQYRDPAGHPFFVEIPDRFKLFFRFQYDTGNKVIKAAFVTQILGYVFSFLEILLFIMSTILPATKSFAERSEWGVIIFAIALGGLLVPMAIRYETNIQSAYDCDWITHFQQALTLLPKRRCRVVKKIDSSTYAITLGRFGTKIHYARSAFPATIGARLYALHSEESGYPFWVLRDH